MKKAVLRELLKQREEGTLGIRKDVVNETKEVKEETKEKPKKKTSKKDED